MTYLVSNGDVPFETDPTEFFDANDMDATERAEIAADIERWGYHAGGGGAAAVWYVGTEAGLRVALAGAILSQLRAYLTDSQWRRCQASETEPDACCDSNEPVNDAFKEIFGECVTDLEGDAQALGFARWNAGCRLASLLMVGEVLTDADALAIVVFDDSKGLGHVVPGYTLATMRAALAALV